MKKYVITVILASVLQFSQMALAFSGIKSSLALSPTTSFLTKLVHPPRLRSHHIFSQLNTRPEYNIRSITSCSVKRIGSIFEGVRNDNIHKHEQLQSLCYNQGSFRQRKGNSMKLNGTTIKNTDTLRSSYPKIDSLKNESVSSDEDEISASNTEEDCIVSNDGEEECYISEEDELVVKEELEAKVKEVKEVFKEVTQSTGKLTETIITNGPGILTRAIRTLLSKELREDFARRKRYYISDWTDAFKNKRQVIPAILFLFFACLAPAVSFGTISSEITNGSIGVVEFLLSSGLSGMAYAVLSGQPMSFIAPTGLTLAFISGLFRLCTIRNVPFFPVYSWVGLWTSVFMFMLGVAGSSKSIKYCTRFTDEVFNSLLSLNFIYEASSSLRRNFINADPSNLTMPFVSLAMSLATFFSTMKSTAFDKSRFLNKHFRNFVKDFGPVSIIVFMSILNTFPWIKKWNVPTLSVPSTFQLSGGRSFLIPIFSVPMKIRLFCALPAVLLTSLFFMDQNISVRLVNNPENHLKKGPAYNLDMLALGLVTGGLSLVGLPWMCGATVQSMNHVRAMTKSKYNIEEQRLEVESVTETRTAGFVIHAMIAGTVFLLPLLNYLPIPVVSGVFLFLGRKLMTGNTFLIRVKDIFAESSRLPDNHIMKKIGKKKMTMFTLLQVACLMALWGFKSCPSTAIFFPSVIGMLMFIRSFVLPKYLTEEEFIALGDATP